MTGAAFKGEGDYSHNQAVTGCEVKGHWCACAREMPEPLTSRSYETALGDVAACVC